MKRYQQAFNGVAWITGIVIVSLTADNLWQLGVLAAGLLISGLRFVGPNVTDRAIQQIELLYRLIYTQADQIEREWNAQNSAEIEGKRVILAEMRSAIPGKIRDRLVWEERQK